MAEWLTVLVITITVQLVGFIIIGWRDAARTKHLEITAAATALEKAVNLERHVHDLESRVRLLESGR